MFLLIPVLIVQSLILIILAGMDDVQNFLNVINDVVFNSEEEGDDNPINAFGERWPGWENDTTTPEHHTSDQPFCPADIPEHPSGPRIISNVMLDIPIDIGQPNAPPTSPPPSPVVVSSAESSYTPPHPPPDESQVVPEASTQQPPQVNDEVARDMPSSAEKTLSERAPKKLKTKGERKDYNTGLQGLRHIWPPFHLPRSRGDNSAAKSRHVDSIASTPQAASTSSSSSSGKSKSASSREKESIQSRSKSHSHEKSEKSRSSPQRRDKSREKPDSRDNPKRRTKEVDQELSLITSFQTETPVKSPVIADTPASPTPSDESISNFTEAEKEVVAYILQDEVDDKASKRARSKSVIKTGTAETRKVEENKFRCKLVRNRKIPRRFVVIPPQLPPQEDPKLRKRPSRFQVIIPFGMFKRKCKLPRWKWQSFNRFGKLKTFMRYKNALRGELQLRAIDKSKKPSDPRYRREPTGDEESTSSGEESSASDPPSPQPVPARLRSTVVIPSKQRSPSRDRDRLRQRRSRSPRRPRSPRRGDRHHRDSRSRDRDRSSRHHRSSQRRDQRRRDSRSQDRDRSKRHRSERSRSSRRRH